MHLGTFLESHPLYFREIPSLEGFLMAHDHILANILTEIYNKLLSYFVLFIFEHDLTHAHCDQLSQHRASKSLHTIKYRVIILVRMGSKIRSTRKDIFTRKIDTEEKNYLEKFWSCLARQASPLLSF